MVENQTETSETPFPPYSTPLMPIGPWKLRIPVLPAQTTTKQFPSLFLVAMIAER